MTRKENLSQYENGITISEMELKKKGKLARRQLNRMVTFFVIFNICIGIFIIIAATVEHFAPDLSRENVITDKVVIAYIGGITLQSGAILVAAFKGLFATQGISGR